MKNILALVVMMVGKPLCFGIELHPFLSDNMVLARAPLSARLWGWGIPGEHIVVTVDGLIETGKYCMIRLAVYRACAVRSLTRIHLDGSVSVGDDGRWQVNLPVREASTGPHTILVTGSRSPETLSLSNVAFGDVYLCAGQSNMEFSVSEAFDAEDEIADSIRYPHLRFATVRRALSSTPQERAAPKTDYTWAVSAPDAFSLLNRSWPSAVCYFFARDLYQHLRTVYDSTVPIGFVSAAWGGQRVEVFSSPEAMADDTCGGTQTHDEASITSNRRLPETSELWNTMIHPFLNMRFAGAVWCE